MGPLLPSSSPHTHWLQLIEHVLLISAQRAFWIPSSPVSRFLVSALNLCTLFLITVLSLVCLPLQVSQLPALCLKHRLMILDYKFFFDSLPHDEVQDYTGLVGMLYFTCALPVHPTSESITSSVTWLLNGVASTQVTSFSFVVVPSFWNALSLGILFDPSKTEYHYKDFGPPGGPVANNLSASRDAGSIPHLGRPHMQWGI